MDEVLGEEDWGKIQSVLHGRDSKWLAIGIQLNVSHAELTKIKRDHGHNLEECNREMQIAWLKMGKATWRALVAALRSGPVGLIEDANSVQEKYQLGHESLNHLPTPTAKPDSELPTMPVSTKDQQVRKSLLSEQLEWLLKMGYTVEDITEWTLTKKKSAPSNCEGLHNTTSSHDANLRQKEVAHKPWNRSLTNRKSVDRSHVSNIDNGRKTPMQTRSRKRTNTSQTKQPRAKRTRSSKAIATLGSSSEGEHLPQSNPEKAQGHMTCVKKKMLQVLEEIEEHPAAEEFIDPVEKERATDYYDIVEDPMCLSNMKMKVYGGHQKCDFDLIVKNCEAYNGAESEYVEQAKQMETKFYKLVSEHFPDVSPPNPTMTVLESNTTDAHNTSAGEDGHKRRHGSVNLTSDEEDVYGNDDLGNELVLVQTDVAIIGSDEDGDSDDSELELPSFSSLFTSQSTTDKK